ncbi:hypothetical protein [Kitasatospora purpeofusca]|uniref:hypothetical protein n=1 Tax=Kitasatospora purpeofusca TaxID=67352 RepID=UPI0007C5B1E2|nr:hypothetical protein [Kitasatospora purpeofusca]
MGFVDEVPVPVSEDWADWLVYARVLSEAGDPRGEAIRLEHRGAPADDPELAALYRQVERDCGLDGLRADGSWRLGWSRGFLDTAGFRLTEGTGPADGTARRRRALVVRLLAELPHGGGHDPDDPEQWEAALVDVLLRHPAAGRLRTLELRLTDHHHSAGRAAAALAARRRPRLAELYLGHHYDTLFELHRTSTGRPLEVERYLHDPVVPHEAGRALWPALPALRSLELEGAFLFDDVVHEELTHLRTRGAVFSDGSLFGTSTPGLVALEVEIDDDVHGTVGSNLQLEELAPAGYPRLRHLDLGAATFEPEEAGDLVVLAEHPLLPQLESLTVRELVIEDTDAERDPLAVLTALVPRFAHLELRVAGAIEVEGAEGGELERVLAALGLGPDAR